MALSKNINMDAIIDLLEQGKTYTQIAKRLGCCSRTVGVKISELRNTDSDLIKQNVKLAKQKQRLADLNRINNKTFREDTRVENAITEYTKELVNVFTKHKLPKFAYEKVVFKNHVPTGIIHLTDAHFNELIDLSMNKYDFNIASKRIKLLVEKSIRHFNACGIKNVLLAITGDLMNSDRRLDELLSEATNRSKATFLCVAILEQMILDLAKQYNVTIASVVGNESRVGKDVAWEEHASSDNYDFVIFNILKLLFRDSSVRFLDGNSIEQVVEVAGQNVLLIHGNQIKGNSVEQSVQKIKGKYVARNVKIDYVLFGHLHSCRIGDTYSRGSSVCGANAYSDGALQLESRASQNIHIFYTNGSRDSIRVDLQNTGKIKGYNINKELEAYNAKSLSKAKKKVTISKVVI